MDVDTQYVTAALALVGLVNGVQFAIDKNWQSFIKFMFAVVAGTVLGFIHWFGLPSAEVGFLVGLSSSGIYKIGQVLSNK